MKKLIKTIDFKSFISQHNLVWDKVEFKGGCFSSAERKVGVRRYYLRDWDDGAFIGNGMTGAMIYKESPKAYKFELGRNDVIAHNFLKGIDWATPRVPIGDLVMIIEDEIVAESMEMKIYEARVEGEIKTKKASFSWSIFNHAEKDLMIIDVKSTEGLEGIQFAYRPKHGVSPRINFAANKPEKSWIPPEPLVYKKDGINLSVQTFVKEIDEDTFDEEGACCVAWCERTISEHHKRIYLSITNSYDDQSSIQEAINLIQSENLNNIEGFRESHELWWHKYYEQSYLSLSDKKWEKFYWIQMYKLASAINEDIGVLDSQGPWLTTTPWPTTVWNLNVELSYMSLYTSNRMKLGESLIKTLKLNKDVLIDNAKPMGINDGMYMPRATSNMKFDGPWPETYELGNLTWALHNVWRHYQVTMNKSIVDDVLFPFLKLNMNSYMAIMTKDKKGIYHIPGTSSPEYPSVGDVNYYPIQDCNYTLSLFRWGLNTLLDLNSKYKIKDELATKWKDVLEHLVDYQKNENGLMVGSDIGFDKSHRHFSHMLMVYPLYNLDPTNKEERTLIEKSLERWLSLAGKLQGYTFTGASSIASLLGNGDQALEYLNGLDSYLTPNTMYSERGPVIETPLSAAESMHRMVLQSEYSQIKIFPAMPSTWLEAEFIDFMAEGAYKVSAKRQNGHFVSCTIESLYGGEITVIIDDFKETYQLEANAIICFANVSGTIENIKSEEA